MARRHRCGPSNLQMKREWPGGSKAVTDARLALATAKCARRRTHNFAFKGKWRKLALSAVGLPYNTTPEHARHEFVAGPCRTNTESTVGEIGNNNKADEFLLASVLQAASPPKVREPWKPRPGTSDAWKTRK